MAKKCSGNQRSFTKEFTVVDDSGVKRTVYRGNYDVFYYRTGNGVVQDTVNFHKDVVNSVTNKINRHFGLILTTVFSTVSSLVFTPIFTSMLLEGSAWGFMLIPAMIPLLFWVYFWLSKLPSSDPEPAYSGRTVYDDYSYRHNNHRYNDYSNHLLGNKRTAAALLPYVANNEEIPDVSSEAGKVMSLATEIGGEIENSAARVVAAFLKDNPTDKADVKKSEESLSEMYDSLWKRKAVLNMSKSHEDVRNVSTHTLEMAAEFVEEIESITEIDRKAEQYRQNLIAEMNEDMKQLR